MAEQIPYEYQTSFGEANQLEQIAKLLAAQRQRIAEGAAPQMVSGYYVRMSPMQGLADLFASYQQGSALREAARKRQEATERLAKDEQSQIGQIARLMLGRPEMDEPGDFGPGERGRLPAISPNPREAARIALASQFPRVRELGKELGQRVASDTSASMPYLTPEGRQQMLATGMAPSGGFRPEERWGPLEVVNVPGHEKPFVMATEQRTGKPLFAPQGPTTSVNVDARSPETTYYEHFQKQLAASDAELARDAQAASENLQALGRVKKILSEGPVTAGPESAARLEVTFRNLLNQLGLPVDKALDERNARLTAESASYLAAKILKGGRAITDQDIERIAKTFPGISSGVPYNALPAFIAQLEAIAGSQVNAWNNRLKSLPESDRSRMPATFGDREILTPPPGLTPEEARRLKELEEKFKARQQKR